MNYELSDIEELCRMYEFDKDGMILNLIEDWKEMNNEINDLNKQILEYGLR